jgi:hypothetical protein
MANYQSFYDQGIKSAKMGNTRSPGGEYRMPVFGTNKSWQSKAFSDGFKAHCKQVNRSVIID